VSVPVRSDAQRADALAAALAARQERSRLRAALKSRDLTAVDVITGASTNPVWGAVRVSWLLACMPGIGAVRAERIMERLQIAPSRRVQGLGERQRAALLEELASHG
jgi:S13-like H2TH domain